MADIEELVSRRAGFDDLPTYLTRYIDIRHSAVRTLSGVIPEVDLVADCLTQRNDFGRRYLAETISGVRYAGASVQYLLDQLSVLSSIPFPAELRRVIAERVPALSFSDQTAIADTLRQLSSQSTTPAARVLVDRAIGKILPELSGAAGTSLGRESFVSTRASRRKAARKFYGRNGLDADVRAVILEQVGNLSVEAPELVAIDAELIRVLGLEYVLAVAPSTYYRKLAIELAIDFVDIPTILEWCSEYPQELVWALHDKHAVAYAHALRGLADSYRFDPYLLNRIVQCMSVVGDIDDLRYVVAVADAELTRYHCSS